MPGVRKPTKAVAILCSDIHLSIAPPIWRSAEPDWLKAQARVLDQLKQIQAEHCCPIIIAGDIFHKWNSCPELINFALKHLPEPNDDLNLDIYAIPGQHDLPEHNYREMNRSAYLTLVRAGRARSLKPFTPTQLGGLVLYGFPYGFEIQPAERVEGKLTVAVVHQYYWVAGKHYGNPPKEGRLGKHKKEMAGYDIVVIGDNHQQFQTTIGNTQVYNCGCLIRRNLDEKKLKSAVGLLFEDGHIETQFLDTAKDKYLLNHTGKEIEAAGLDMADFITELESLGDKDLDFNEAVLQYLESNKVGKETKRVILTALGVG